MMSIAIPLIPVAACLGYFLGVGSAQFINRGDLRRLRMLSRHVHHLELELFRHLEHIRQLRWRLSQPRSTSETVARKRAIDDRQQPRVLIQSPPFDNRHVH